MNDKQLALSNEQWGKLKRYTMLVLTISFLVLYNLCFYYRYFRIESYKGKGIYEIEGTFSVSWYESSKRYFVDLFFMICDPPKSKEELKQKAQNYIAQNHVIEEVNTRVSEYDHTITDYYLSICFMEPTEFVPIGWKAQDTQDIFGYMEGLVFSISLDEGRMMYDFHGKYVN